MGVHQKKNVALKAINRKTRVADIAKQYDVSRQFIYRQKDRAISAVDDAFNDTSDDNGKNTVSSPCYQSMAGSINDLFNASWANVISKY